MGLREEVSKDEGTLCGSSGEETLEVASGRRRLGEVSGEDVNI